MIDWFEIKKEISDGYVYAQRHPTAQLTILNYTQKAQYDWHWSDATKACRGLIIDDGCNIVSRPFEKFFSYEQLNGEIPSEPFEAFEKLDGSLGILYHVGPTPFIATRGSFTSEQAIKATEIYRRKYDNVWLDRSKTYLFEIIYPDNRIVVDYGGTEDLFLLAVIDTATGKEVPLAEYEGRAFKTVKRYDGIDDFDSLLANQEDGREGFVVRFQSGMRVKIKFEEYKRLHKLLTGVNPRHIWECLRAGTSLDDLVNRVPDEYFRWVKETENDLRFAYAHTEAEVRKHMRFGGARRELAEYYKTCRHPSIMFAMLDGKDYSDMIWKQVKPDARVTFTQDDAS